MSATKQKNRKAERMVKENRHAKFIKSLQRRILTNDSPFLSYLCQPAENNDETMAVVKDLKRILAVSPTGVGLAANQIGQLLNVIVIDPLKKDNIRVMINPVILESSEEKEVGDEGCLSYPGIAASVSRSVRIKVKYQNESFAECVDSFEKLESRVIQHEMDHLLGRCLVNEQRAGENTVFLSDAKSR